MPIELLIDAGTIAARVAELGRAITQDFLGKDIVLVPVLKGSYVFAADLARRIELDVPVDRVRAVAHRTQPIERRHAERGSEVAV